MSSNKPILVPHGEIKINSLNHEVVTRYVPEVSSSLWFMVQSLLSGLYKGPTAVADHIEIVSCCALLASEAMVDITDIAAHQHAGALHQLWESWPETSSLNEPVKKHVLVSDLAGGNPRRTVRPSLQSWWWMRP